MSRRAPLPGQGTAGYAFQPSLGHHHRAGRADLDTRFPGFLDSIIASTGDLHIDGFEDDLNEPAELSRRDP